MTNAIVSQELLDLLVCPENHTQLQIADDELVRRLNQAIETRQLKNRSGQVVETPLDGALVREDRQVAYPIVERIPVLLVDEGIPLEQVEG